MLYVLDTKERIEWVLTRVVYISLDWDAIFTLEFWHTVRITMLTISTPPPC